MPEKNALLSAFGHERTYNKKLFFPQMNANKRK
jgi:hypothetical protein